MVTALASYQCDLGSIPARCHMWVEFVIGSCLVPKDFLRVLRFSSFHKNQLQIQFDQYRGPAWKPAEADVSSSLNIVIHLIYFFFCPFFTRFSRSRNPCDKKPFSPRDFN